MNKSRTIIKRIVDSIQPVDGLEREHRDNTLIWIEGGSQLYRSENPSHHLVSYFVVYDPAAGSVLLFDHRKAGLWLPSGGHLEAGELPVDGVRREMQEELFQEPVFHRSLGLLPLFITVTQTRGAAPHTDVSLWFVVEVDSQKRLRYDEREYAGHRWMNLADIKRDTPRLDPHMYRFGQKLMRLTDQSQS